MMWSTPMCLRKAHLFVPPADPMTVWPLSLAIWQATDPTAPAAGETNTTSPDLSAAIFKRPPQAVRPVTPATPRNAGGGSPNVSSFSTVLAGALNRSRQPNMDETRSPGLKPGSSDATTSPTAPPCNASPARPPPQRFPNLDRRAPAVHSRIGRGNLSDFARWSCVAHCEVRVITRAVDHATAHIGVDRHPEIFHLHFAKCGGGHGHRGELEIVRNGRADKAAFQTDFAGRDHDPNLSC